MSRPVAVFMSRTEAELAKAKLELAGIRGHVFADDAGGWEPQMALSRGVRLEVADEDRSEAMEVLGVFDDPPENRPMSPEIQRFYRVAMWAMVAFVLLGLLLAVRAIF